MTEIQLCHRAADLRDFVRGICEQKIVMAYFETVGIVDEYAFPRL